jgi:hypothetical protein
MASKPFTPRSGGLPPCGVGWICTKTNEPGHERARLRCLMYTPPHTPRDVHKKNPGRGRMGGTTTDRGFYSLMVALAEVPRNAQRGRKEKAALPSRRR